ncbi:MAG TPA: hypothetical protein VJ696_13700 [Rhodanobacteraceae bacterium]|nr:hypothetical protein [Rhodanobacteraceae bacterium]
MTVTHAEVTPVDAVDADYTNRQLALYDALIADPSPRTQVLTTTVYVPSDDATPTALRPKREDVVARAVAFAPDDAFVQWRAAANGNYVNSRCGPTRWPEAEVANLVRLEPDNAGAWLFAVALAEAKGDDAAIDETLSRMAGATRADDHLVDEIAAWTSFYRAHPELGESSAEDDYPADLDKASLLAMERLGYTRLGSEDALKQACTPDASSDRTWRRLGWCADAGRVLAEKGTSLALRAAGLAMLKATGEQDEAIDKAERQYDWLDANDANPLQNFGDGLEDIPAGIGDWRDAKSEIAAIEHRLKRLGLPSTPPPEWHKTDASSQTSDEAKAFEKAYTDYMSAVIGDMRTSASPEARVFAALMNPFAGTGAGDPKTATPAPASETIAALAKANAANLKVQWMIASVPLAPDDAKADAIAIVQEAESDNAGAWAFSLAHVRASDPLADTLLQRMAGGKRFDMHEIYGAQTLLDALQRRPMPPELVATMQSFAAASPISPDFLAKTLAMSIAYMSAATPKELSALCNATRAAAGTPRRDACIAIGRLLMRSGTTMLDFGFGESMLRKLDALDGNDAERVRRVRWWADTMRSDAVASPDSVTDYIDEFLASGNEIEALRHRAERLGKAEPPAGWKPGAAPVD